VLRCLWLVGFIGGASDLFFFFFFFEGEKNRSCGMTVGMSCSDDAACGKENPGPRVSEAG